MNSETHPDELLAWYVNGTLDGSERAAVERHLRDCARCRDEAAFLDALRRGVKEIGRADEPGDLGRKRLLRDVRAQQGTRGTWWRPALAAAAAIIIVQGVLLVNFWPHQASIGLLGGPKDKGLIVQIQFQPDAAEARIRALLQETGATLIDGPGALGIYRIRLERSDTALARLRSRTDVVKYAALE
jgi:anti-sigma factor RsiW